MSAAGVTEVLQWLVDNKLDALKCLKPLVSAGYNNLAQLNTLDAATVKKILPKSEHRKALAGLRKRKSATEESTAGKGKAKKAKKEVEIVEELVEVDLTKADLVGEDAHVLVNRAPVLQLWSSVVAETLGYDWSSALSLASQVVGLCAYSKGKAIGLHGEAPKDKQELQAEEGWVKVEVELMGMKVRAVKKGDNYRGWSSKGPVQPSRILKSLRGKFKDRLELVYTLMKRLAKSVNRGILHAAKNRVCYDLYCGFRPSVAHGKQGWGAQGRLEFSKLQVIKRDPRFFFSPTKTEPKDKEATSTNAAVKKEKKDASVKTVLDILGNKNIKEALTLAKIASELNCEIEAVESILQQLQMEGTVYEKKGAYFLL